MVNILRQIQTALEQVLTVVALAVALIEAQQGSEKGETKKAEAIKLIQGWLPVEQLPVFLRPFYSLILSVLIDLAVAVFNRDGFFATSSR